MAAQPGLLIWNSRTICEWSNAAPFTNTEKNFCNALHRVFYAEAFRAFSMPSTTRLISFAT